MIIFVPVCALPQPKLFRAILVQAIIKISGYYQNDMMTQPTKAFFAPASGQP
jgi:hypothetical protein